MFPQFQARHLAPLALFLCAISVRAQTDRAHELASQASSQVTADCQNVTTLADCHPGKPTGCSNAAHPRYDAYLNFLKTSGMALVKAISTLSSDICTLWRTLRSRLTIAARHVTVSFVVIRLSTITWASALMRLLLNRSAPLHQCMIRKTLDRQNSRA